MRISTTTSPKNFDLVRTLGAHAVYDYVSFWTSSPLETDQNLQRDPNHGQQIRRDTNSSLSLVLDCVSTDTTAAACAEAIGTVGGKYANLLDSKCPRADVESTFFLGYSVSGESYIFEGEHYDANEDFFKHGVKFAEVADKLWEQGKFTPHPQRLERGGFDGILGSGLQIMREGKYSAEKLVYRTDDTM